ncbi:Hsp20 family protein [Thalassospiraceae bacterium LMO-SO8]|jgi:molecular chaperone IbpA|nr:Hsp20 family protein [Alphaproteobacteria bacterium LMO-S08]WND75088.1 Hsp20 family protein [Thalassospiraceae bacterium LMO-SO8]
MRTIDFTPLFRHSVGFDRLERLLDSAMRHDDGNSYPPYNIEQLGEDTYRITMAVAGFGENDLDVTVNDGTLTVTGKHADSKDDNVVYVHRGIAGRAFERRFQLADHIEVKGGALENGLLHIELERVVPEEKKPRKIEIAGGQKKLVESKAA